VKSKKNFIAIVGGGPSGLRVAEILSSRGFRVELFDQKPSVGRKFLIAGRGGLNITHSESMDRFSNRYFSTHSPQVARLIRESLSLFSNADLRSWVESFGIETYVGSSGRIYPEGDSAAKLLMAWVERLKRQGVVFSFKHFWKDLKRVPSGWSLTLESENQTREDVFDAVVFAMGGGSWSETGSDGRWIDRFLELGIKVHPFLPANCGWEVDWEPWFLDKFEGKPVKGVEVWVEGFENESIRGDLMVTKYGLEGTPLYTLTRTLRTLNVPVIRLDLKPDLTKEALKSRFKSHYGFLRDIEKGWKLSPMAKAILLRTDPERTLDVFLERVKNVPILLNRPRPIDEAISSAGGVSGESIDESGMLRLYPGCFTVGEMNDWEAPTGGYLLQGCFSAAQSTSEGVIRYLDASLKIKG
jgi:uncharacterized flavoprotein (TIGR03862 family)